ncbi:hypothetical protein a10_08396 [Streptomyces acidiscabies]|nr:hypothetical protein a10_08396 [Streptomyces acidiscabies]GAV45509.1 hypothetical protein Saa2_08500 [Streptomyces acidiscabies]
MGLNASANPRAKKLPSGVNPLNSPAEHPAMTANPPRGGPLSA